MSGEAAWLDYGVRWRTGDVRPGRHAARTAGAGGALRGFRPFWQMPDARRVDVRRSILDPGGELVVRQTDNRGSIGVMIVADLSRSMRPRTGSPKLANVVAVVAALSRSAHRAGDRFGFVGFDDAVRSDLSIPLGRARGAALDLAARLARHDPQGRNARGLAGCAAHLPERRCLVLLISDFLLPSHELEAALSAMAQHDVALIVVHDPVEASLPQFGLLRLQDAETGSRRLVLMRPRLAARLAAEAQAWRARLDAIFLRYCRPAFHATGALDMAALGQHLLSV